MSNEEHQAFLTAVMNVLSNRVGSQIMILIDNGPGFETISTNENMVWSLGVLEVAKEVFKNRFKDNRNVEMEKEALRKTQEQLEGAKGKAN